uniref:ERF superfamily protein n=1 Tax=Siphoviridae sp. ctxdc10 TaxID=2825740 RepID=A0A8S5TSA6_9CAUD|nr:MAG TPA: ERF superfamily protein [Siphoviridae sp. ctxdc10]
MMKELFSIQSDLKVPKSQYNSFGEYKYRSCEDILEAVKPLLKQYGCMLNLSDEIVCIGDRYYVKSTAKIVNESGESEAATAYAREDQNKKGMDGAQITGAASSYARKYALNGLFCIDDTKDADTDERRKENEARAAKNVPAAPAPASQPAPVAPKKRITADMLNDPILRDQFMRWAYKGSTTVKDPTKFDVIAFLRRTYDADDTTAVVFAKFYDEYLNSKQQKR